MTGPRHAPKRMIGMAINKLTGFGKHRYHPYHNPGHKRQGRIRAHFSTGHQGKTMGDTLMSSEGQGQNKKQKTQEAQMIPGLSRNQFGFPNTIISTHRYCDSYDMTSTLGIRSINVFAANGTFDPDLTGGGHQPMYRDTYASIYDQYVVIGAKITVRWSNGTAAMPAIVGIVGDDDSTISTDTRILREQNNSVHGLLDAPGGNCLTQTLTFSPLEDFGVAAKDDGSSATAVGSNPSELWCFAIWAVAHDVSSTVIVKAAVEIEYTVKWSELQTPSLS